MVCLVDLPQGTTVLLITVILYCTLCQLYADGIVYKGNSE